MNDLLTAAKTYKHYGLSIIAVREDKSPLTNWREYQNQIMADEVLIKQFNNPSAKGIAIVCGKVSGNLEIIDQDVKNDLTGTLFIDFYNEIKDACPHLIKELVIASTKNEGYHFFYKCANVCGSQELARRPCTASEIEKHPGQLIKVLTETRGNGGYVIVHPSEGYQFIQNDLSKIPNIESCDRNRLLDIARSFDLCHETIEDKPLQLCRNTDNRHPFNDFNNRVMLYDIIELLQRHGWSVAKQTTLKTYFKRPGETDHKTSGDFHHKMGLFGVHSPSTQFIRRKGYRPSAVYAILECNGDFKQAAKELLAKGYGVPYKDRCKY
jgi:hypothetical protein